MDNTDFISFYYNGYLGLVKGSIRRALALARAECANLVSKNVVLGRVGRRS